jgi:hypothetical protein
MSATIIGWQDRTHLGSSGLGQPFLILGDHTRRTRRSRRGIGESRPTIAQSPGEVDDSPSARPAEVPEMATLNCFHSLLSDLLKVRNSLL